MKPLLLLTSLFSFVLFASAQKPFPESYVGKWKGNLEILTKDGPATTDVINVTFDVAPVSKNVYQWRTTYDTKTGPMVKDYKLIVDTLVKGHYTIDEGDSIVLDGYYIGQKLYCTFEVDALLFFSTYEKQGDRIIFEIAFGPFTSPRKTGDVKLPAGIVPRVMAYKTESVQRAVLKLE
jgi:hypothetical protein